MDRKSEKMSAGAVPTEQELLRLAAIVQSSNDAIIGKDPAGIIQSWNPAAEKIYGYTAAETLGKHISLIIPHGYQEEVVTILQKVVRGKRVDHYQTKRRRKDGRLIDVSLTVSPIKDSRGKIIGSSSIAQDITERMRAEAALQASETSLREAQRIAQIGNWEWNLQTNELTCSEEMCRIFGLERNESAPSYEKLMQVVHPDDRELLDRSLRESVRQGKGFALEHRLLRYDRSVRIVHEQGEVFRDASGNTIRMFGTVRDLTDLALSRLEMQKLAMAVEQSSDWILITDRKGRIEYVNDAVEDMTGYRREELLGQTPRIFKSGRHDDDFYRSLWDTILSGQPYRAIVTNRRKDGRFFDVYHSITPMKDPWGNVTHFVATSKDITQQKLLEEKLNYLSHYDVLTELPNRMLFRDRLHQAINSAEHHHHQVAVICIDIDRFTLINDAYGYEAGDQVLREVARRFSKAARDGDTVSRLSADEFGVVLAEVTHSEDVVQVIDKLMHRMEQPIEIANTEVTLTLSMGISLYPGDGLETEALLTNADIAMSRAKGTGMDNYQFFMSDMNVRASEFVLMERHLRNALKKGEFLLHYQPYFQAQTGKIAGMEALLRWQSEDLGLVMPTRFIPVLEDTGLIIPLGQWVLQTVCGQLQAWQNRGLAVVPVAFNLSAVQFRQKDLGDVIEATIREAAIDPRQLTMEITESTFMQDLAYSGLILERLKKLGIRLAIDDFGTGYSSLSYLKRLPLDLIKIDISFVRDIITSTDDAAIVAAIVSLAHSLNLHTIAEGVETSAQLDLLRRLGCDLIQGFLFSRPRPAADVEVLLRQFGNRE